MGPTGSQEAQQWLQDGPKMAQKSSKRVQDGPKEAHDGLKLAPRCSPDITINIASYIIVSIMSIVRIITDNDNMIIITVTSIVVAPLLY